VQGNGTVFRALPLLAPEMAWSARHEVRYDVMQICTEQAV
jgi:hypothetical protein